MKKVSAVINARLGSTRVPHKLVRPFAETTLIDIALDKLNRCNFFDYSYLAVAEDELAERAAHYENVYILPRGKDSVKKGVNPLEITLRHYTNVSTDWIFTINPCQPLLSINTLKKAFDTFQSSDYLSYLAAIPVHDWIFDQTGHPLTHSNARLLATNKTTVHYKASHSFYIINTARFRETSELWSFTPGDPFLIVMPEEEALDIDTLLEFKVAELYYQSLNGHEHL